MGLKSSAGTRLGHDPWEERFGFLWYNDREIFEFTDSDFDRLASSFEETGINHLITFSCTHFRWSFRPWWSEITEVLRRATEACHAHGIAITEHHSSHLTFNPLNTDDENYMERILEKRGSSTASWPGLREYCDSDPIIGGEPISSFRQIDGRTGEWARSSYRGYCMCFNNPGYRSAYLSYLETLYAVGIDGIMTDDVQYFALESWDRPGHACACAHCRRLFSERTGFELPHPDMWAAWHGDYESESIRAWIDFRRWSTREFHRIVAEHYEGLGLRLLRPNYVSGGLNANPTAYCLDDLPRLDWVFQENCFSHVIRYSWPSWAIEASHRNAVAERRNIPSMSMFYPDREDTTRFAWSLAMSWGQLYVGTGEGATDPRVEAPLRDFEREHADAIRGTRRIADIAFYDSDRNRTHNKHAGSTSIPELFSLAEASYLENVGFALVQRQDLERLHPDWAPVLVVCYLSIIGASEKEAFARYVDEGGSILWIGPGAQELAFHVEKLDLPEREPDGAALSPISVDRWISQNSAPTPESLARFVSNAATDYRRAVAGLMAKAVGDRRRFIVEGLPTGVIATAFDAPRLPGAALHLVDTRGSLTPESKSISHDDPIPNPGPVDLSDVVVRLRGISSGGAKDSSTARAFSMEGMLTTFAPVADHDHSVRFGLKGLILDRYALIEVAVQ